MKWEENVRRVTPYTPGEQPQKAGIIKLNTNENPYGPAPGVAEAIRELDAEKLRLYPAFPEKTDLAKALAEHYQIGTDQIFIGVGSDDVLSMIFLTFFQSVYFGPAFSGSIDGRNGDCGAAALSVQILC